MTINQKTKSISLRFYSLSEDWYGREIIFVATYLRLIVSNGGLTSIGLCQSPLCFSDKCESHSIFVVES